MRILFVSTKGPLPTNDGHSLRTYNLLREVAESHEVHLLSFVKFPQEYDHLPELQRLCSTVRFFDLPENSSRVALASSALKNLFSSRPLVAEKYECPAMRAEIVRVVGQEKIDLVHLDMLPLCCYLDCVSGTPVILNQHNVESALLARRVVNERNPLFRSYLRLQHERLETFEREAVRNINHIVCCSDPDRKMLQAMAPSTPVAVVPNGVDADYFRPQNGAKESALDLVFVGGMNWFPNRDALQWFDRDVFPQILGAMPEVRLRVVGVSAQAPRWVHGGIEVTGFVDDIRPHLDEAAVFVVPLRIGGGTRLKILDAMAMGKAIVSTSIGAEGLDVLPGRDLVIADTAEDFAVAVLDLLRDRKRQIAMGNAARELVETRYRWKEIGKVLQSTYIESVKGSDK